LKLLVGVNRLPRPKIKRLYLIPILSKALDVLELLEQNHAPMSLEDVYQKTEISKTSVYRILKTLAHRGYLSQGQNGLYRLVSRPRRLRFGFAAQNGETPFSMAVVQSVTAAAAAAGVELLILDNLDDHAVAIHNAEMFVAKRMDLVIEFQVEERIAPRLARIFKKADLPLVAVDVPHPIATYLGVDHFEVGVEAGSTLAQHALRKWKGKVDWVLGVGCAGAGSFAQNRIDGAFEGIRERLPDIPSSRFLKIESRSARQASQQAVAEFLRNQSSGQRILVAAATDSSALGVLGAARELRREPDFAIVGQQCIPEVIEEIRSGSSALIGTISHEAETYGPRLIQLGIAMLRGYTTPAYNYVRHKAVTSESLGIEPGVRPLS
jgi:ribose transport system substrate-binding protein